MRRTKESQSLDSNQRQAGNPTPGDERLISEFGLELGQILAEKDIFQKDGSILVPGYDESGG